MYDDICYLRQAHLFQRFGLSGLDTDISRDDDHYLSSKLKEIGFPTWNKPATAPCHNLMPATQRRVMQYPPGTGAVLALFPSGHQLIPLYVSTATIMFGFALLGIFYASAPCLTLIAGGVGCLAVYLMVNPAKASYSMAPTMAVCALAGFLTARLFGRSQQKGKTLLTVLLGFVLGLSVDFRLPNLFLSSAYFLFFLVSFLSCRKMKVFLRGVLFIFSLLVGMAPTLIANMVNAGSPLKTTYSGNDLARPDFALSVTSQYLADLQFALLAFVGASIIFHLCRGRTDGIRRVALIVTANLLVNLAFFMSHPIFTPYYTVPVAMLSLWSLLFNWLMEPAGAVDGGILEQAVKA
ncbi:hypothetical protein [Bradyrhizobium canariense]|uniref:hypothetical protein n=1 Tax=Bradyrhizobium canariense TaxID=255045 RepID=UPI001FCCD058|nr:hypothetical protein [Bradyrhizobium canariense]